MNNIHTTNTYCNFCKNKADRTNNLCSICYEDILERLKLMLNEFDIKKLAEYCSKRNESVYFKYENKEKKITKNTSGGKFIIKDFYFVHYDRFQYSHITSSFDSVDLTQKSFFCK